MKHIGFKPILFGFASSLLFSSSLYGYVVADKSVETARKVGVKNTMANVEKLTKLTVRYINSTLDTTPTRGEIENYFGKKDLDYWKNYRNQNCTELNGACVNNTTGGIQFNFDTTNKNFSFSNIMGDINTLTDDEKETYLEYTFEAEAEYSADLSKISFDFFNFSSLESTLATIQEGIDNAALTVSLSQPADTNQFWKKPNKDGTFNLFIYDHSSGTWVDKGKQDILDTDIKFYKDDGFDPITTTGVKGQTVSVQTEEGWKKYTHDGTEWVEHTTNGSGESGMYNGTGTVLAMATSHFTKGGGSIMEASAPSGEWSGAAAFTKKDDVATGGYWITADGNFIVTNTIDSLSSLNSLFKIGATAFIKKDDNTLYKLKKLTPSSLSARWVYIATNYPSLLEFKSAPYKYSHGVYFLADSYSRYFTKNNDIFTSDFETNKFHVSDKTRNDFSVYSGHTYLLQSNDCTSTTCNGTSITNYYAGSTTDGMYTFYYATSGNRKNNLIDAVPRTSITDIYNYGDVASVYNDNIYLKRTDTRGRIVYYNLTDGYYYSKNGNQIPIVLAPRYGDIVNLPPSDDASVVSFSGDYIILDNRTEATNWTDAPNNAGVRIDTTNYVHLVGSGKDFWTNNNSGDGQASATEIFTNGSRSSFPTITHSLTAITKSLGSESRYTSNGVTASIDSSFKQWFYSTSGTRTSNLLDAIPTANAYIDNLAISVGYAYQSNKVLVKSGNYWMYGSSYVDKDLIARSPSNIVAIGIAFEKYYSKRDCTNGWIQVSKSTGYYKPTNALITNCTYNSVVDAYYDNNSTKRTWYNAKSYCSSKGMRLPTINETYDPIYTHPKGITNGIPRQTQGTWTSTQYQTYTTRAYSWGDSYDYHTKDKEYYTRCIKKN